MKRNLILMGQAEVIDMVRPEVRKMLNAPGIYICRDTAKPEYTIPLSVHGGKVFSMVEDKPLKPERFLATAEFHGPYFGDPAEGEHGRLTREVASLRAALQVVLDQVDYTAGACGLTEMVGAALPKEVITRARLALRADPVPEESTTK